MRRPDLTTGKFLTSPELQRFCEQFGHRTLTDIHLSFVNTDRISALIRKRRLLSYPQGQSVNGVIFERERNPEMKDYARKIFMDPEGPMIICAYDGQAQMLTKCATYEVDISYKRVKDKDIKEVVFASFYPEIGKIRTSAVSSQHKILEGVIISSLNGYMNSLRRLPAASPLYVLLMGTA